jgi:hypothetical protein
VVFRQQFILFVVQGTPFCYEMFIPVAIKAHNFNLFYNLNFMRSLKTLYKLQRFSAMKKCKNDYKSDLAKMQENLPVACFKILSQDSFGRTNKNHDIHQSDVLILRSKSYPSTREASILYQRPQQTGYCSYLSGVRALALRPVILTEGFLGLLAIFSSLI